MRYLANYANCTVRIKKKGREAAHAACFAEDDGGFPMTPETIFGAIVITVIAIGFVSKLIPKARPKDTHFRCARCNATAPHTDRTVEVWRNKKNKFYCQACHKKWIESQPTQLRSANSVSAHSGGPGCLGVVAAIVVVPAALIASLWAYFV